MTQTRGGRAIAFAIGAVCLVPMLSAQILVEGDYHGKRVICAYSGLRGVARSCDTQRYERVFTGTVKSFAEVGDTDKNLELVPDEVFVGDSSQVTAITNQACLRSEIQTGDKWLFYLYRDPKTNALLLAHDSPSRPVVEAQDQLSMLRELIRLKNSGLLIGTIRLWNTRDKKAIALANHEVIAKDVKTGAAHTTNTNANGYFQFDLPPGTYDISMSPKYRLREVESIPGSIPESFREAFRSQMAAVGNIVSASRNLARLSTPTEVAGVRLNSPE